MADLPINYGDSWKVARDKINDSFNELAATVEWYKPQIINWVWWIWTTNTGVKAEWDSIVMKVEDWYIWYKSESNSWTKIIAVADLKWSQGNPWADWNWIASVTSTKVWKTTTVTMNFDEWEPFSFEVQDWADWVWWDWDVKWPDSSTNWHIAVFDWATWKVIRDWGSVPTWFAPWNTWTTGQVLKKTNSWYEWDDESGWWGSWDVTWPASSTDGDVAIFDWTTGKLIKDGSVALSTLSSAASLASSAIQPWDDISDLNNDSGFITGIDSWDVTTALGYTPYNSTNPAWYTTNTWDVVWPASSTDWHLAVFDWATWKLIKDGGSVPTWVPSWWTDGQVLSKVSWNIAWANPSGWDVKVSSQAHNLLTTGMKIWCGTEWDYANLGTYDSNSLYLTVPWGATPWGWQPWVNTLAYYPLESDVKDYSWNNNDGTNNGVTFSNVWGVDCAVFTSASTKIWLPWFWNFTNLTVSAWIKTTASIQLSIVVGIAPTSDNKNFSLSVYNWTATLSRYTWVSYNITDGVVNDWVWHNILGTYSSTWWTKLYVDWVYIDADATTTSVSSSSGYTFIGWHQSWQSMFAYVWNISNVILETAERNAQEISDYYNQTKWDYWIS